MTLREAIEQMERLLKKHGNVDVWFDCPKCGCNFEPNKVVAEAVHITEGERARGEEDNRAD